LGLARDGAFTRKDTGMDKNRLTKSAKPVRGAVKAPVLRLVAAAEPTAEGRADKTADKIQNTIGGTKDASRH
jgi:uncharacterized protein YjbJ (UPF0337 family)